jgi:hypothetical protein
MVITDKKKKMFLLLAAQLEESNNGTGLKKSLLLEIKYMLFIMRLSTYFPNISNKLSFGQTSLHIPI